MTLEFIFTINGMFCTLLFPNCWITAPYIHAEIEWYGELSYSVSLIYFSGEGREKSHFLFN